MGEIGRENIRNMARIFCIYIVYSAVIRQYCCLNLFLNSSRSILKVILLYFQAIPFQIKDFLLHSPCHFAMKAQLALLAPRLHGTYHVLDCRQDLGENELALQI